MPHEPARWRPATRALDELIGSVTRGVYVTRFHYVNVEDPISVLLTGMTRDGTFLIENGRLDPTAEEPALHAKRRRGARELRGCDAGAQVRRDRGGRGLRAGTSARHVRVHGTDIVGSAPRHRDRLNAPETSTSPGDLLTPGLDVWKSGRSPRRGVHRRRDRLPVPGRSHDPAQGVSEVHARRLIPVPTRLLLDGRLLAVALPAVHGDPRPRPRGASRKASLVELRLRERGRLVAARQARRRQARRRARARSDAPSMSEWA